MKTRKITYDTITGKQVDSRQEESFEGRFISQICYWNGDEWAPYDENDSTHISGSSN